WTALPRSTPRPLIRCWQARRRNFTRSEEPMPANTPTPDPSPDGIPPPHSPRARRRAARAAAPAADLARHLGPVSTGQFPMGQPELPAQEPAEAEPRELLSPPVKTSRVGRNLPMAIGVGLGLGAVLLASLFIQKEVFLGLAVLGCLGAQIGRAHV